MAQQGTPHKTPAGPADSSLGAPPEEPPTPPMSADDASAWTPEDLRADPHATPDKADRVQRMFAAIARSYDLNTRLHSFGRDQAWRRRAVRLCDVKPTDDVLDAACGTGDLAEAFARAGAASVIGVDFTEPMLKIARHKAGRRNWADAKAPTYQQGDAMNLAFDDASFDIVSIAFGIRNVTDPAIALREFRRVLRPSGRLVVLEFSQPRNRVIRWFNGLYLNRIMPITATLLSRDRSGAYRYLPRSISTFHEGEAMLELITDAGFASAHEQRMTFGVCTAYLAKV